MCALFYNFVAFHLDDNSWQPTQAAASFVYLDEAGVYSYWWFFRYQDPDLVPESVL
jgi:hypothetical protein